MMKTAAQTTIALCAIALAARGLAADDEDTATLVALAADEGAATLVAWHEELVGPGGILDSELTTTAANKIVLRGITSDDPRDVARAVWAMGVHSSNVAMYEAVVSRRFSLIPGLKEFLIDYWNDGLRSSPVSRLDQMSWMAPLILAAQYPADEDVYRIVWDYHAQGGDEFTTLQCLNVGAYNTPEANRMRMDALASEDFLTYAAGALGIAMAKPADGLDALLLALRDNPVSATMPATETALAAYGPEAVPKLRQWRESGDLPESAVRSISNVFDKISLEDSEGR